ncbi:MAG TPA: DinB family protein [Candidatus Limnocylindrales bacterium]
MPKATLSVDEIMAILRTTIPRLTESTKGLTRTQLHTAPAEGEWSINDVLAHLRACGDVLGGAMQRILDEDGPGWTAMSPRTWQRKSGYHDWEFEPAFAAFADQRRLLLARLDVVSPADWQRTATVKVPPTVYERTVRYYGDWLAGHERIHVTHMGRLAEAFRGPA